MKLSEIYLACVQAGIEADVREKAEIERVLGVARHTYDRLEEADKEFYDLEKCANPYADTRICAGDPESEIRGLLVGIDMEVGEVLLADRLRDKGAPIDLVFAHHPEGPGYASLHEVMYMQADLWAAEGVSIAAGDAMISPRAEEIHRRFSPMNHYRDRCREPSGTCLAFVPHARRQQRHPFRSGVPPRGPSRDAGAARQVSATHPGVCRRGPQGVRPDDRVR